MLAAKAAKALRHPLLILGLAFLLQMCASHADQGSPGSAGSTTASTGTSSVPDGGNCSKDGDCALPVSRCSDNGAALVYYTHPSCTDGTCSWTQEQIACPCSNGGCVGTGTSGGVGTNTAGPGITMTAGPTGFSGSSGAQSGAGGLGDSDASDDADAARQSCNESNDCTLPPSYCKDASTLVFATRALCANHLCELAFSETKCTCSGNGCIGTTTK